MNICDFIPVGKENAVTREQLRIRLNLPDRKIRQMIEDARRDGALIMNAQDGAGYWMSEDLGELKRQLRTNKNRAMSILRQNTHILRKIEELEEKDSMQMMMEFGFTSASLDFALSDEYRAKAREIIVEQWRRKHEEA